MKFRIALTAAATIALAACGSTEDASTEAEADSVEITADDALQGIDETPVEDPAANEVAAPETGEADAEAAATEAQQVQDAGDRAADTAAAAMDAMGDDTGN